MLTGKMNEIVIDQLNDEFEITEQMWHAVLPDFLQEHLKEPDHDGPKQWKNWRTSYPSLHTGCSASYPPKSFTGTSSRTHRGGY